MLRSCSDSKGPVWNFPAFLQCTEPTLLLPNPCVERSIYLSSLDNRVITQEVRI